jgi:hypothetical protein
MLLFLFVSPNYITIALIKISVFFALKLKPFLGSFQFLLFVYCLPGGLLLNFLILDL